MIEDVTHIRPLLYTASGFSMNGKEERRPPMVQIQRKYNFMPGTTISSGQVNEEFTNLVNAHNDNDTIVQNVNEYMFSKIMSEQENRFYSDQSWANVAETNCMESSFSKVPFVTVTAANGDIGTGDIVVYLSQVTTTFLHLLYTINIQQKIVR